MTQQPTLYTFGYLASRGQRVLSELIAVKTPIVDVRYNPTSKRYQWTQEALQALPNINYYHLINLGNELYKEALTGHFKEPHIRFHNLEDGLASLQLILAQHGRAAIMCACSGSNNCHRFEIAKIAQQQLQVKVIHL